MSPAPSRRAFLKGSAAVGASAAAASALRPFGASAVSGSLPAARSFVMDPALDPTKTLVTDVDVHGIGISDTPQSFTFDNSTGLLYVATITPTRPGGGLSFTQHAAAGDLTISQVELSTKRVLASMDLKGCGHGISIAAVPNASGGSPDMWFEFNAAADGYGTCVSHYPFTPTDPTDPSDPNAAISAATLQQHLHSPFYGSSHNTPSYDPVYDRMAVRYYNSARQLRFAVFTMSAIRGSSPYTSLVDVALPTNLVSNGVAGGQGWALYGDYIYLLDGPQYGNDCGTRYSASSSTPESTIAKIDLNTLQAESRTTAAFSTTGRREPEGMAIQVAADGTPRLCLGIAGLIAGSGNTTYPHCSNILGLNIGYRDVLTSTAG